MKTTKTMFLCALLVACGDDTVTDDGGLDATTKDVASEGSTKDATSDSANDAKADVAIDAPSEAATDAGNDAPSDAPADVIVDVVLETSTGCDGGCTKYSFECSNAQPACQCVGLALGQPAPVCDAAAANCFVDPCLTKTVQCTNNQCVTQ